MEDTSIQQRQSLSHCVAQGQFYYPWCRQCRRHLSGGTHKWRMPDVAPQVCTFPVPRGRLLRNELDIVNRGHVCKMTWWRRLRKVEVVGNVVGQATCGLSFSEPIRFIYLFIYVLSGLSAILFLAGFLYVWAFIPVNLLDDFIYLFILLLGSYFTEIC